MSCAALAFTDLAFGSQPQVLSQGLGGKVFREHAIHRNYRKVPASFFLMVDLFLGPPCCPEYDVDSSDLYNTSEHQLKGTEDIQMEQMHVRL